MYLSKKQTWFERQLQIEDGLHKLEENRIDFQNPCIIVNPYEIAPLTALVLFETDTLLAAQVAVYAPDDTINLQYSLPAATKHRIPIYGLYADTANKVVLTLSDNTSCEYVIQTEALPGSLAQGRLEGTLPAGSWMFTVPLANCSLTAAYDGKGVCRWYCTEKLAFQLSQTGEGHILTCGPELLSPPYSATAIWEMDLLGKIHREYRVPGGICNGFYEMKNGNLLALHQFFNRGTAADMCIEIDRVTGAVIKEWDFRNLLPMSKGGSTSQNGSDWFHAASVCYDDETDSIVVVGKHQDIIVSIGYTSGQLNWILGDSEGWPEELVQKYFMMPKNGDMNWFYEAESVQLLPNQQLLCFDNGHLRTKKGGNALPVEQRYSRVVCYKMNPEQKIVQELWSFGESEGNQLYSPYMGNCQMFLPNICLMNFGGIGFLKGQVAEPPAFYLQKDYPEIEMQTVVFVWQEKELLGRLQLPINCYHAELISVQNCIAVPIDRNGCVLGNWYGNDCYDLDMEWEDSGMIAKEYRIHAELTNEQLLLSGDFRQGEMVMLLLEGEQRVSYYMQTTRSPYLTASSQTYAKGNIRPITYVVNLQDLQGTYEICIGIDDKKYHTDLWFVC